MLTRSYMDDRSSKSLLAYTPMFHARLFTEAPKFRDAHFQPTRESLVSHKPSTSKRWLDGNPSIDRPLFVQFCANNPDELLEAARYVEPYCDAVDINLGCPQGIAKAGHYGAFLQEDWDTIHKLINKLSRELTIPVTAKMRILGTKEKTLDYAKMILSAGASIITVHGRNREQKGHNTGVADWSMIRYLRDNLPQDTVIFANGNILNREDIQACLDATGADGIMSAEGNLSDPTIFAKPPTPSPDEREYWRGRNGHGGYRIDGVVRRYLDIIYRYVLERPGPERPRLYLPSDASIPIKHTPTSAHVIDIDEPPRKKKRMDKGSMVTSPSLKAMQGHLFQILHPMLSRFTNIRDMLAKLRTADLAAFEDVLAMVEDAVNKGLQEYDQEKEVNTNTKVEEDKAEPIGGDERSNIKATAKYMRPWWICQPHLRPLPEEAIRRGAMRVSKKDSLRKEREAKALTISQNGGTNDGFVDDAKIELPRSAVVCG